MKQKEPLRLLLNVTKADDFGKYQASLNGVKLGEPMDFYSAKIVNEEFHLLDFWPEPGTLHAAAGMCGQESPIHRLLSAASSPCACANAVRAWPQYGFDKDKDWRKHLCSTADSSG